MLYWALVFLMVAISVAVTGGDASPAEGAWVMRAFAAIFAALFALALLIHLRGPRR